MSPVVDLRELTISDLSEVAARIERIERLQAQLGSPVVLLGTAEGDGGLRLTEAVGHLSFERLLDLECAATQVLRILFLDGLAFGEQRLEGLSEEALLERLGEILRMLTEEGIAGLPADRGDEGSPLPGDHLRGGVGVPLHLPAQEPGDELAPDVGDLGRLVPVQDNLPRDNRSIVTHPDPLSVTDPILPRRATPPP